MQRDSSSQKIGRIRNFLLYAKHHRIPIHSETRKIGIVCTLIGWASIAFIETAFPAPINGFAFFFSFFIQFLSGTFCLFIASLFLGKYFLRITEKTEKKLEDQSQHITHLSVHERRSLVFWRGVIAVIGCLLYSFAKSNSQVIDNSAIFSADAIMYTLIMLCLLKIRVRIWQWASLAITFLGVCFIVSFDILGTGPILHNIVSVFVAFGGAACLAVIVLLNSVIIQHEPPLRVAFFQCLIGLICATAIIGGWIAIDPVALTLIDSAQIIHAFISGTIYAVSLVFFFNAFLYTEPFIIVILGYSIFPFITFFSWIFGNALYTRDIIGGVLIAFGGSLSVFLQFNQDKKNTHASIAGYPIYLSSLKEKFRALRQDFVSGRLGPFEYLSQKNEFNKLIFEYAEDIKTTDIKTIEIGQGNVVFQFKADDVKMFSDKGCRSAPLEVLNFGAYEKTESSFLFQMLNDGDTIIDVGANVGWYSIQLAKKFKHATIHSFEPIPQTFAVLEKNISLNNIENVTLHNIALGESEEQAHFFYFQGGSAIASRANLLDHEKATKIICQVETLDVIAAKLNLSRIDLLKCDVEGAELGVIKGGLHSIKKFLPIIYIELFDGWCEKFNYTPDDVIRILNSCGYQCFKINGQHLSHIKTIKSSNVNFNFFFLSPVKHFKIINNLSK